MISSSRLKLALSRSVEHLDEELQRFERAFASSNCQIFWADDFREVHSHLTALFKELKTKQASAADPITHRLFRELGVKELLDNQKIVLTSEAPVQLFVADYMISESGQLLFLDRPLPYLQRLHNGSLNIVFTTIEHILPSPTLLPGLLFGGASNSRTLLVIADNSRTNLLTHKLQRQALACIQCGRCQQACPVDQVLPEDYYDNVFTGPLGRVVLPFMESPESYGHVVWNCTLCGACEEVCPLQLPLRDMIVASREEFLQGDQLDPHHAERLSKLKRYLLDRSRLNRPAWRKQQNLSKLLPSPLKDKLHLPKFADRSFNQSSSR